MKIFSKKPSEQEQIEAAIAFLDDMETVIRKHYGKVSGMARLYDSSTEVDVRVGQISMTRAVKP